MEIEGVTAAPVGIPVQLALISLAQLKITMKLQWQRFQQRLHKHGGDPGYILIVLAYAEASVAN